MVLGLLVISSIPTVTAVAEGVHHQRRENEEADDEARMAKFNLEAFCEADEDDEEVSARRQRLQAQLNGKSVVLRDGKAWLDEYREELRVEKAYLAQCFYINYPDDEREKTLGLVTRISDDPPMLNWLYVDARTLEVKYGNRTQSREHYVGDWDWTTPDGQSENARSGSGETAIGERGEALVFDGFEGFVAVEEDHERGHWALYFDKNDDGLRAREGVKGKRKMNVTLKRVMCDVPDDRPKNHE